MASNFNMVDKKKTILVKPLQPTPSDTLSFSTFDNDPNLGFISRTIHVFRANDDPPSDESHGEPSPAVTVEEALSKALVFYYPFAGRFKRHRDGKLRLDCTGEGVPLVVAAADCTLASLGYLNLIEASQAKQLVDELKDEYSDDGRGYRPLMLQVTEFACGGFTLGMGLSHSVCDGFGAIQFLRALLELAGGGSEPSVKPVWERERLIGRAREVDSFVFPLEQAALATCPHSLTMDLVHQSFTVGSESIRKLKARLMSEASSEELGEGFTTLEVLGAYVWRAKVRALDINLDGMTTFSLAVGLRNFLDPPLPKGYYGNAFVTSNAALHARDLTQGPLVHVVKHIKMSKKMAATTEYLRLWLDMVEKASQNKVAVAATGAVTALSDWRRLGILKMRFGCKEAVNMVPVLEESPLSADIVIFMSPSSLDPSTRDGVRVLVCLPRAAMAKFKQDMDSLNHQK